MSDDTTNDLPDDGIDRRGFLKCMAWAGTGVLWTVGSGILRGAELGSPAAYDRGASRAAGGDFRFVQISDSHIGFSKDANRDVAGTLREAVDRINASGTPPAFLIHTGDISHLSKPDEFDAADEILKGARTGRAFFVPGEHDVLSDDGKRYLERYGKETRGQGWYSFDHRGVHFIGLVNVVNLKAGGLGLLGSEQLEWLEHDLKWRSASTPIVVFAHIPLWSVYPAWGWGTDDAARALTALKRFGSVTVLNGHIHQTMQKVEGSVTFHTAASTAFPQPRPGAAPSPGPMTVPAERLRGLLGITDVRYLRGRHALAIADSPLAEAAAPARDVTIDTFSFTPNALTVPVGTAVTWTNRDDVPHTVVGTDGRFRSPALDTGDRFTFRFPAPGRYGYFCSVHPRMTGAVVVG